MAAYAHEPTYFPRRILVLLVIVLFHALLVYVLATGLARKVVEVLAPPIQTNIIEEVDQNEPPPPPPPPTLERPPVEVPPPDIQISIPIDTSTSTAITDVTDRPVAKPAPPPPKAVVRVPPKLDVRRSPSTDDYYPPSSKRAEEEGVVTVYACVSPDGRTTGTPTVSKSSGYPRLDEAALKWASRARWSPGTEDGKPVESCQHFNIRFKLIN